MTVCRKKCHFLARFNLLLAELSANAAADVVSDVGVVGVADVAAVLFQTPRVTKKLKLLKMERS